MGSDERRCSATNAKGERCGAPPEVVDPDSGLCPAHQPGGKDRLRLAGIKGAKAARGDRPDGLTPEELPALEGHAEAKLWLEKIGRAVATGRLEERAAHAATRAVKAWLDAHAGQLVSEDVELLRARLRELEGELDGGGAGPRLLEGEA